MQPTNCLNCNNPVEAQHQFCASCGQQTSTHRITTGHIWHDLLHAFTHADKSIFSLIGKLLIKPGIVAGEYVEGKRKKYFNPFAFLVLVLGISSVILISSGFVNFSNTTAVSNPVSAFLNKHVNLVIFLNVPLLAFYCKLFFGTRQRNFSENLVLVAYTSGERSVFFSLIIAPLWMLIHQHYYLFLGLYVAAWHFYFAWGCRQFFSGKPGKNFMKGILVALCSQLTSMLLISAAYFTYFSFFYKKA